MMTLDLFQDAKGEDVAEVEIERHDNAGIGQGTIDQHRSSARSSPNVRTCTASGPSCFRNRRSLARHQRWPETAWFSGADWVDFVLGQGGRVGERLTDVFLLEGLLSF